MVSIRSQLVALSHLVGKIEGRDNSRGGKCCISFTAPATTNGKPQREVDENSDTPKQVGL